jgi:hypothetical protein
VNCSVVPATVGVSVGHSVAQVLDECCSRCGLFGLLAFPAVEVVFGRRVFLTIGTSWTHRRVAGE